MQIASSATVLGILKKSGERHERVVAIGDRLLWRSQPVELVDLANLGRDWRQVLVRFADDVNRPLVSMPYQELIDGLAS